jgi:hypothetical protein
MTRRKNRIHKVLQDANINLSSVATDVFGASGKAMIMALLAENEPSPAEIKSMTKGRLRNKIWLRMISCFAFILFLKQNAIIAAGVWIAIGVVAYVLNKQRQST